MSIRLPNSVDELRARFFDLQTPEDVARLLDVEYKTLNYYLFALRDDKKYKAFAIPKHSGGMRDILAPIGGLKIIQQKLNQVLQAVYEPKATVHAYCPGRSIVSNARTHQKQRYVLNIDLQDFFPTINFGRVRGVFMAVPYRRNAAVATVLAQICTFQNHIPQGAPTSPIISNMLCARLDSQLRRLAQAHGCIYSRYADDITFSTSRREFPSALARLHPVHQSTELGSELKRIVETNGFTINPDKIRLCANNKRLAVTGLTVNRFPNVTRDYVRQLRSMLYKWRTFGPEAAAEEFAEKYDRRFRSSEKRPQFAKVVKGRIDYLGMVRGPTNHIYQRFLNEYKLLMGEAQDASAATAVPEKLPVRGHIFTEGKTDWRHLKNAYATLREQGKLGELDIYFWEFDHEVGNAKLLSMCDSAVHTNHQEVQIFVFDQDDAEYVQRATSPTGDYKKWSDWVYSFAIPVPPHRMDTEAVCIEMYYRDEEITRADRNGRRLFLSSEFRVRSGWHKSLELLWKGARPKRGQLTIVDNQVFDKEENNVALSKADFANYVLNHEPPFDSLDVAPFMVIFDVISRILKAAAGRYTARP